MAENTAVATIGSESYATTIVVGKHTLVADEPVDKGGKDIGPHPGEFLRMSLASCTAITLRMYASRKNFDVQKIMVAVSDGSDTPDQSNFITRIEIMGKLNDQQRQRMLQIAKLCPVHKTLANPIEIETSLTIKEH